MAENGDDVKVLSFSAVEILPSLLDKTKTQTIRPLFQNPFWVEFETIQGSEFPAGINYGYGIWKGTTKDKKEDLLCLPDKKTLSPLAPTKEKALELYWSKVNELNLWKKPRFKVEKVKLLWKQRSKYEWFCKKCGEPIKKFPLEAGYLDKTGAGMIDFKKKEMKVAIIYHKKGYIKHKETPCVFETIEPNFKPTFPKELGEVEITEVFEIEMGKGTFEDEKESFGNIKWGEFYIGLPFAYANEEIYRRDGFKTIEDMFKWFDKKYDLSQPKRFAVYRW